ncbi:hypothetical protein BJ986_001626 [Phycicoccus badiiscoriae]|uniref:Uncharacterized protein n=1 Tax=Pedococcus badiiscoriae TaxID=642776 RepID=A0A852WEC6_9MICO|nr:hypothetical protein [Pedococcus badiiscoriae]NYG07139.1 hypothetical protein [Pedococcus badiiscoriae]
MPRLGERAGLVGLAAFLIVDVLLVGFAISSTRHPVDRGGSTIGSGVTTTPSVPGTTTATTTGPSTPAVRAAPLTQGIVAVDKATAFRFTLGNCKSRGSKLELTRNAGASWGPRSAPFDTIVRVRVRSDRSAFVVGADSRTGCTPAIRQASTLVADFGNSVAAANVWFRDPRASASVGLPTGGTGKPCGSTPVVDLAIVDAGGAALCTDGRVRVSTDGQRWTTASTVPGAIAVALTAKGRALVVVPGVASCSGLAVIDAAKPTQALGCAMTDVSKVQPGTVALSVTSGSGWLAVGDAVFVAGGDLSTWKKS